MWRRYLSTGVILLILLSTKSACANTLEISPTLYLFSHQEFDQNNTLLNEDEGEIPGIKLSYADVTERDSIKFNASFFNGSIDNTGETLVGTPNVTETEAQLFKLGISYAQHELTVFPGLLFAGLHYWNWDRDILTRNGIQGIHEEYTWYETELGLKFISDSSYWLELSAMYNFKPETRLFLPSSEVKFTLQSRPGYRIRAGKTWTTSESMTTSISLFSEYWEFGESDIVFTTDFFGSSAFLTIPNSETFNSGLEFSFILNF
jgi:hypothetical protein